jgi:hypothetical protein
MALSRANVWSNEAPHIHAFTILGTFHVSRFTIAGKQNVPVSYFAPLRSEGSVLLSLNRFFALEDAMGSHTCPLEVTTRVTNDTPLDSPLSYRLML